MGQLPFSSALAQSLTPQLAVVTTDSLFLYQFSGEKLAAHLKQTIYPPSIDIAPVSFRSAR